MYDLNEQQANGTVTSKAFNKAGIIQCFDSHYKKTANVVLKEKYPDFVTFPDLI